MPIFRRQMHIAQKDQRHGPQRVRGPEQSQEGEEVGERITESEKAQSQQDGGQQGSALQALLELRPAVKEAIAEPSQNQPGNAEYRRAERPLQTIGSSRYDQAQFVGRRSDERLEPSQRQPSAEETKRQPQVGEKRTGGGSHDVVEGDQKNCMTKLSGTPCTRQSRSQRLAPTRLLRR